jgi:hypothetical protein
MDMALFRKILKGFLASCPESVSLELSLKYAKWDKILFSVWTLTC